MDLDLEELAAVIELLDKADFTDFRYEKGDLRIAVRRGGAPLEQSSTSPAASSPAAGPPTQLRPEAPLAAVPAPPSENGAGPQAVVKAPLLGAFYRAPKPGEAPFVSVGSRVAADTVVCIIEVMKLMNSVNAGVAGEVSAIFASDGDFVEYDQPLFAIRELA